MTEYKLGAVEARFADLVWENAPLTTQELVKKCAEVFEWKRTTTYTVLKRLSEKGLFRLENGMVYAVIPRDDYYAEQSGQYVEETFAGSLPAFIAAFTKKKTLREDEIEEIRRMIDRIGKE